LTFPIKEKYEPRLLILRFSEIRVCWAVIDASQKKTQSWDKFHYHQQQGWIAAGTMSIRPRNQKHLITKMWERSWALVAHACNPSYLGG
jgi:hypothetical protein